MNISKYVRNNHVKLSADEVVELFDNIEVNKETIVKSQLALALLLANQYSKLYDINIDALFSDALYALSNCVNGFKPTLGLTFHTYAGKAILNQFQLYQTNIIKQPKHPLIKEYTETKAYPFTADEDYKNVITDENVETDNTNKLVKLIETVVPKNKHKETYKHIMIEYLGITGDTKTFKEIGNDIQLTGERTRQHYHRLMQLLKKNKHLKRYLKDLNP